VNKVLEDIETSEEPIQKVLDLPSSANAAIFVKIIRPQGAPIVEPVELNLPSGPEALETRAEGLLLEDFDRIAKGLARTVDTNGIRRPSGFKEPIKLSGFGDAAARLVQVDYGKGNLSFAYTLYNSFLPSKFGARQNLADPGAAQSTTLRVRATSGVNPREVGKNVNDYALEVEDAITTLAQFVFCSEWHVGVRVLGARLELSKSNINGRWGARLLLLEKDMQAFPRAVSSFNVTEFTPQGGTSTTSDAKKARTDQADKSSDARLNLWALLVRMSQRGLVFVDAHLGNVMVDPDDKSVRIVDFDPLNGSYMLHHSHYLRGEVATVAGGDVWSTVLPLLTFNILNMVTTLLSDDHAYELAQKFLLLPDKCNNGKSPLTRGGVLRQVVPRLDLPSEPNAMERFLAMEWNGGWFGLGRQTPFFDRNYPPPQPPATPTDDPVPRLEWMTRQLLFHRVAETTGILISRIEERQSALWQLRNTPAFQPAYNAVAADARFGTPLSGVQMATLFAVVEPTLDPQLQQLRQNGLVNDLALRTTTQKTMGPLLVHFAPIRRTNVSLVDLLNDFVFAERPRRTIPGNLLRARLPTGPDGELSYENVKKGLTLPFHTYLSALETPPAAEAGASDGMDTSE
jgi:hypothetical protein